MTTPDGSLSPERDASDKPWEPAPWVGPQTEAEAVEELTLRLKALEDVTRETTGDVRTILREILTAGTGAVDRRAQ